MGVGGLGEGGGRVGGGGVERKNMLKVWPRLSEPLWLTLVQCGTLKTFSLSKVCSSSLI